MDDRKAYHPTELPQHLLDAIKKAKHPHAVDDTASDDVWTIRYSRETDGRWIAERPEIPGALTYGDTRLEAGCRLLRLVEGVAEGEKDGTSNQ